jgi:hypothetical protein
MRIRDLGIFLTLNPRWKIFGSGINIPNPQRCCYKSQPQSDVVVVLLLQGPEWSGPEGEQGPRAGVHQRHPDQARHGRRRLLQVSLPLVINKP